MRYAIPLVLLAAFLAAAPGCTGCGPSGESATVGEAVEETPEEAAKAAEEAVDATVYAVSDQSYIGWAGRKPLGTHFGQFPAFDGAVTLRDGDPATLRADISFHVSEMSSDDTRLTGVLLNENWFHVEEYPTARFTTTSIEPGEGNYKVTGNLEIRGTRKSVSFPAEIDIDDDMITVFAEFQLDRTHWGVGQGLAEDLVVYNDVAIELDVIAELAGDEA